MRVRALAVLVVAGALAAGCGGSGTASNGEASKPPQRVVTDAVAAANTAKGVHVSGSILSAGQPLQIDLDIVEGTGGAGSITEQGVSLQFVRIGSKAYVKGSDAFDKKFAGRAAAELLHDKWLEGDATEGSFAPLTGLTDIAKLIPQILKKRDALKNEGETTYKGQKVVAIRNSTNGGTLYVAATGRPYPVAVVRSSSPERGTVTFADWNKTVSITAPKGAIDISNLGG